jgi:hypothetical protein
MSLGERDILRAGLQAGYAQRRVGYNSSLFFLHTIKAGGFCQISRHEGETGNVDCMDATEASAIISISGEPDPFGMEIVRIRSRPRAIHAALQTTA